MDNIEKVKTILDRECYQNWHAKRCQRRAIYLLHIETPCWICDRNYALAREITEAIKCSKVEEG